MSYEGYTEMLCEQGHRLCVESYNWDHEPSHCPVCNGKMVFRHEVDQTNGIEWDENGIPLPHTVSYPFEEDGWDDEWLEDHYGNRYAKKILRYKIPQSEG